MDFSKFDLPVLPVFRELFADGKANLLFIGRIIPNKKVEDVIRVFHHYQRHFNPDSRLFIVGEYRGFERYVSALQGLVAGLGTRDVHFSGHVPLAEVVSYAKLAHLYLHMSEHEGFCAPVVESFHLGIPVVAFDAGAVGETMNGGGVLVREKDPLRMAGLCHEILSRPALRAAILAGQERALEKYRQQRTGSDPARLPARAARGHERHEVPPRGRRRHRPLRRDQPQGPQPQPVRAEAQERPGLVPAPPRPRLFRDRGRARPHLHPRHRGHPRPEDGPGRLFLQPGAGAAARLRGAQGGDRPLFPGDPPPPELPRQLPAHRQGLFPRLHGRGEGARHHHLREHRHAGAPEGPGLRAARRDRPPPQLPVQRKDPRLRRLPGGQRRPAALPGVGGHRLAGGHLPDDEARRPAGAPALRELRRRDGARCGACATGCRNSPPGRSSS